MNSNNQNDLNQLKPENLLTTGEAARELDLATGTLQNWRSLGEGPDYIKHRRSVYYLRSEIEQYKRENFQSFSSTTEWKMNQ